MTTKQDRKQILDTLEEEYLQDLSIHLYSTFLLHRINPIFPKSKWANWPKSFNEVPIPQAFKQVEDNLVDEFDDDVELNQVVFEMRVKENIEARRRKKRKVTSEDTVASEVVEEEEASEESDASEASEDEEESEEDASESKQIVEITTSEQVPNAKSALINEIATVIHRTIRTKLNTDTTPDIMSHPNMIHLTTQIANKFDRMLNNLLLSKNNPMDWTHVLQAGLETESTPYEKFDIGQYEKAYNRCESLFENVKYNYEFEDDMLPPEGVITDEGFNVLEYLKSLKDCSSASGQISYAELAKSYMNKYHEKCQSRQQFKLNYFNKLEIEKKYHKVSWSQGKGPSTRINLSPDLSNLEQMRASILAYGNNGINKDTYTLENI